MICETEYQDPEIWISKNNTYLCNKRKLNKYKGLHLQNYEQKI